MDPARPAPMVRLPVGNDLVVVPRSSAVSSPSPAIADGVTAAGIAMTAEGELAPRARPAPAVAERLPLGMARPRPGPPPRRLVGNHRLMSRVGFGRPGTVPSATSASSRTRGRRGHTRRSRPGNPGRLPRQLATMTGPRTMTLSSFPGASSPWTMSAIPMPRQFFG